MTAQVRDGGLVTVRLRLLPCPVRRRMGRIGAAAEPARDRTVSGGPGPGRERTSGPSWPVRDVCPPGTFAVRVRTASGIWLLTARPGPANPSYEGALVNGVGKVNEVAEASERNEAAAVGTADRAGGVEAVNALEVGRAGTAGRAGRADEVEAVGEVEIGTVNAVDEHMAVRLPARTRLTRAEQRRTACADVLLATVAEEAAAARTSAASLLAQWPGCAVAAVPLPTGGWTLATRPAPASPRAPATITTSSTAHPLFPSCAHAWLTTGRPLHPLTESG